jgi:dihydrofolate synthase / folylpolyglutamate synthase
MSIDYVRSIELLTELYHAPIIPARQVGLARVRAMLDALGNPHQKFRSVHVAGTSGKGSTTSMIGSILQRAGTRTGVFRSPHLYEYTERIALDGRDISRDEWTECFRAVWPVVDAMREGKLDSYSLGRPSFFEVTFALAALYFARNHAEWTVMETGMGGRLDATNALEAEVAIVTNVSLEHTHILGATVPEIASEKAAIIKPGCNAVTAATDPQALNVIETRAREVGASLLRVGFEVIFTSDSATATGQEVTLADGAELRVKVRAAGDFQARNAATAYAAVLALRSRGFDVSDAAVSSGLETLRIPGRMETLPGNPTVVLDGAHNPDAMRALKASMCRLFPTQRIVILFAAMTDKDVGSMAENLHGLADAVYLTRAPETERAARPDALAQSFSHGFASVHTVDDVTSAWERAYQDAGNGGILLVTGSMYLVGYVRHHFLSDAGA